MQPKVQIIIVLIGMLLVTTCRANNNLQTKYEWKLIDFNYDSAEERQEAINNGTFIPENVIPVGIDVHDNRLFVSLPRLKNGVPASLATINMNDLTDTKSPLLKPYPSWQSHQAVNSKDVPDIISPFHIKIDKCQRLWAVDTGIDRALDGNGWARLASARILIFDLRNDNLIREHELSALHSEKSLFSNIAVEDNDCGNTFAYIADASTPPSLTVYSFKLNESWQVKHNFFNIDPLAGNFSISGIEYRTTVGLYGLALSEKKTNGFSDLYFHALTSFNEFNVSTEILRNKSIADSASQFYNDFTVIGSRQMNEQAGSSAYDKSNRVIFYTLPNMNGVACWRTTSKNYTISNGNVFSSATELEYPIDVKVDQKDRLWVLSNNLHRFINGKLNGNKINFHIHFSPVKEAIKNTACEPGFFENVVNKVLRKDKNSSTMERPAVVLTFIGSLFLWTVLKITY